MTALRPVRVAPITSTGAALSARLETTKRRLEALRDRVAGDLDSIDLEIDGLAADIASLGADEAPEPSALMLTVKDAAERLDIKDPATLLNLRRRYPQFQRCIGPVAGSSGFRVNWPEFHRLWAALLREGRS